MNYNFTLLKEKRETGKSRLVLSRRWGSEEVRRLTLTNRDPYPLPLPTFLLFIFQHNKTKIEKSSDSLKF